MKKRIAALCLVVVMMALSLLACSQKEEKKPEATVSEETTESNDAADEEETLPEATEVVLNEVAHSIFYAPMYVAIEEGYFEEEGIALTLITGFGVN